MQLKSLEMDLILKFKKFQNRYFFSGSLYGSRVFIPNMISGIKKDLVNLEINRRYLKLELSSNV